MWNLPKHEILNHCSSFYNNLRVKNCTASSIHIIIQHLAVEVAIQLLCHQVSQDTLSLYHGQLMATTEVWIRMPNVCVLLRNVDRVPHARVLS